jgi:predicted DNA-binding antitoxin AbrB/MazE fold protein
MVTTIKARFSNGVLKPLESLSLKEGEEVTLTIVVSAPTTGVEAIRRTSGGWVGLVDAGKLKREFHDSRSACSG